MTTCEDIQVAHEMWVHGAPAPIGSDAIAAHTATCEACRAYVDQSERIETMTAITVPAVDFTALATQVRRKLRSMRWSMAALLTAYAGLIAHGIADGRPAGAIFLVFLGLYLFRREREQQRRLVNAFEEGGDLVAAWRARLDHELAEYARWAPLMPFALVVAFAFALTGDVEAIVVLAVAVPGLAYGVWSMRKLRAERARW